MTDRLLYDIHVQVLAFLHDDRISLYNCALVDRNFNNAASKVLYRRVCYSPEYRHVLDLKDRGVLEKNSMLKAACTPHHAPLVIELEISGYISTRPPSLFNLGATIANAIQKFVNLSKIMFCPVTFHGELFVQSLELLPKISNLQELAVNPSCTGDRTCHLLTRIESLRRLTLDSPGRLILDALPEWLGRLSPGLLGLHLKDNCGSITPGVLKSFVPHVIDHLRELTLGLSYSLQDEDVFTFLSQLPLLERLQLQHYLQLRTPKTIPKLMRLKYFAADYLPAFDKREVVALCRWVKWVISSSPIEHVCLIRGDQDPDTIHIPFDSLIDHLATKHASTLRILDFKEAYVSVKGMKSLLHRCNHLEEVYVAARIHVLVGTSYSLLYVED
ncbi:hypothetical protein J132_05746 [Termitomyces sp. J132]|nr:hypothetical protein J132_05746 [Termitomyces sp. J132]